MRDITEIIADLSKRLNAVRSAAECEDSTWVEAALIRMQQACMSPDVQALLPSTPICPWCGSTRAPLSVRMCRTCGAEFHPTRRDSWYCGERCNARARLARFREAKRNA